MQTRLMEKRRADASLGKRILLRRHCLSFVRCYCELLSRWRNRSRWRRRRCSCGRRGLIDQILQLLAGLEERNLLRGHVHAITGLRITPDTRLALTRSETPKAADFNLVAGAQRAHHAVKNRLHDYFAVFPRKFCQTR